MAEDNMNNNDVSAENAVKTDCYTCTRQKVTDFMLGFFEFAGGSLALWIGIATPSGARNDSLVYVCVGGGSMILEIILMIMLPRRFVKSGRRFVVSTQVTAVQGHPKGVYHAQTCSRSKLERLKL